MQLVSIKTRDKRPVGVSFVLQRHRLSTYLARSSPVTPALTHSCVMKVTILNTTALSGTQPKAFRSNVAWMAHRITDHWHLFLASSSRTQEALACWRRTSKYLHQSHWAERMLTVGVAAITTTTWSVTSQIPQATCVRTCTQIKKELFKENSVLA